MMQVKSEPKRKKVTGGFTNRLLEAISKAGYSRQVDFLNASGIKKTTFLAMKRNDRKPNSESQAGIRKAGINPDWVLYGTEPVLLNEPENKTSYRSVEDATPPQVRDESSEQAAQYGEISSGTASGGLTMGVLKDHIDKGGAISELNKAEVVLLITEILKSLDKQDLTTIRNLAELHIQHTSRSE